MMKGIRNYLTSNPWQDVFFKASTYFFVGSLPLFLNLNTIALWFFIISSILTFKAHDGYKNLKTNRYVIISMALLFLLFLFGLWLSKDVNRVQKDIGRVVPLVLIPLFVSVHRKKDFNIKNIYKALGFGLFIGIVICWINIFMSIISRENYIKQASYFFEWIYTDFNLVKPLDGHPSYFAVLLVLFIGALLFDKQFEHIRKQKLKFILLLFPFFLFLIETNSRVGVLALVVIVLYHAIKRWSVKLFISVITLVLIIGLLSVKFDYLGSKFRKLMSSDGSVSIERVDRWKEIIQVFNEKDKFWFGVGSGDSRLIYRRAYYNGGFDLAFNNNYNAHNQYLEFFVCNGIVGLSLYLFIFFFFLRHTYLQINALHFFIVFVMFSMSESFFGRSQGVMAFSFFYSLLILYYKPIQISTDAK